MENIEMFTVDAMGLSCPEPILLLKRALKEHDEVLLLVDNKISVETCSRFARSNNYAVTVEPQGRTFRLTVTKQV